MSQSFGLFQPHTSGYHALNPLTKLALAALALSAALFLPGLFSGYLILVVFLTPQALWGRVLGSLLGAIVRVVAPFALSLFLIQGLFWQSGPVLFQIGPLSLMHEGVLFAILSTGRILVISGAFILLALTTRPDDLMIVLAQHGLPANLTYLILSTIQIIPRFQAKAAAIMDAQQARGLETQGGLLQRARSLLPLIVPLVLGSILDVEQRSIALEARGFKRSGPKTFFRSVPDSNLQTRLRVAILVLLLLLPPLRLILALRS